MSSRAVKRGVQPVSARIRSELATSTAGSPGRRSTMRRGTARPLTRSTLRITSSTECPVPLPTGAEFLAGSTRMAAGTAQKIALNLFSTRVMTELGRVYRGRMVQVVPSNAKLVARAHRIVAELTGAPLETAAHAHDAADGDIRLAVLMLDGLSRTVAQGRLDAAGGDLRRARDG